MIEVDDVPGWQHEVVACEQPREGELAPVEGFAIGGHGGDAFGRHRAAGRVLRKQYPGLLVTFADRRRPVGQRAGRHGEPLVGLLVIQPDDPLENKSIAILGVQRAAGKDVRAAEKGSAGRAALHEHLQPLLGVTQKDERRRRTDRHPGLEFDVHSRTSSAISGADGSWQAGPRDRIGPRMGRRIRAERRRVSLQDVERNRHLPRRCAVPARSGRTGGRPAIPTQTSEAGVGFLGCFGFFGSLRCRSRLPMENSFPE